MSRDWSQLEVEAVVADYFDMMTKWLSNEDFSKAAHRRFLRSVLDDRTDGSVEYKHSNISAVLVEMGYPYLPGYKPQHNYQKALVDVVLRRVAELQNLDGLVADSATASAALPLLDGILERLVATPAPSQPSASVAREHAVAWRVRRGVDYLAREARNTSLGLAGEQFVVEFERARLKSVGAGRLADRVEHVALSLGDGLGYDVRSFELDGSELMIEVKTTGYGIFTPFYVTPNELEVSRGSSNYRLYRLFDFRLNPRLFSIAGSLDASCVLEPSQYLARVG